MGWTRRRMAGERIPKRATVLREQGRRRRGRPILIWEDCIKRDVKKTGEEGDWKKKTGDREGWRRIADEAVKKLQAAPHPDKGKNTHTHIQTHTHTDTHRHIQTHTRTHARTHARTHTHTHTQIHNYYGCPCIDVDSIDKKPLDNCFFVVCQVKVWFYIALYPVRWTAQSALHFPPLADLFIPTPFSASLGSILAMQQLRKDYSLTFPPLSIARYSFIQLSRLRRREVKENAQTSKR